MSAPVRWGSQRFLQSLISFSAGFAQRTRGWLLHSGFVFSSAQWFHGWLSTAHVLLLTCHRVFHSAGDESVFGGL